MLQLGLEVCYLNQCKALITPLKPDTDGIAGKTIKRREHTSSSHKSPETLGPKTSWSAVSPPPPPKP